ncbi:MAG: hypothetical protein K2M96_01335 [Prevotella sp.]|nr:hypothetical protein [Prevotella sp.]
MTTRAKTAPTKVTPCTDTLRTMRRPHPHRMPTHSASCPDTLRTMHGRTPHNAPPCFTPQKNGK